MLRMSHEATSDRALATPRQASPSFAMAPHLSLAERDIIAKAAGEQKAPKDIHALISAKRRSHVDDCFGALRNVIAVGVQKPRSTLV